MVGIDVVDIERFRRSLTRNPALREELFTLAEQRYCDRFGDPVPHLAGTLAAKEAVIKALGLGTLAGAAKKVEVERDDSGAPRVRVEGSNSGSIELSISHDGPVAVAIAFIR